MRALAGLIAALAVVVTPALFYAHARLVRSTPAVDGRVTAPPTAVSLWFSERPELRFTTIQLVDSAGAAIPLGAIAAVQGDAMAVTAPVTGAMTPGRYAVVWRTAASDGHATLREVLLRRDRHPLPQRRFPSSARAPRPFRRRRRA